MRACLLPALLNFAGMLALAGALQAQFTWDGNSTGGSNITDAQNWTPSLPTGSGSENVTFDASGPRINIVVPTNIAFNNVTFGTSRPLYTFSGSGSPVLTLNGNVTVNAGSNAVTFNNSLGIALASNMTVDVANGATLQVNSVVSGTGHLSKIGAGTLVLSGANTLNYNGVGGFNNGVAVDGGTLELNGGSISQSFQDIIVGSVSGGTGTLIVSNGGDVVTKYGVMGNDSSTNGTITVTGAGSTWTNSQGMALGYLGTGFLNVLAGGTVTTTGSGTDHSYLGLQTGTAGTAVVSGTGSAWTTSNDQLIIGGSGTGDLTISSGGLVANTAGYIGQGAGGAGAVSVNNGTWNNSAELLVGSSGTGTLNISAGGDVTNTYSYIATQSGSTGAVVVDGAGSTWVNSGLLAVGQGGTGALAITNGGVVSNTQGYVGYASGSSGTALVDGAGSTWTSSSLLEVANAGTGLLTLANGGKVTVNAGTGTVSLGASGGNGTLNIGAAAAGSATAGGIVNAATITTGTGSGTLQFKTNADSGTPYYLTKDGTSGGAAVAVTGSTSLVNTAGYNILTGANTYTGGTTINGGTLALVGGSISHSGADLTAGASSTLAISGGGDATTNHGFIGYGASGGIATVAGSGSTWTLSDELIVGAFGGGQGNMTVSAGGAVSANRVSISYVGPATSYLTATGAGSSITSNSYIYVGSGGGNARFNIAAGATASSATGVIGLDGGYGWSTLTGSGTTWDISSGAYVGYNSGGIGYLQLNDNSRLNVVSGTGTVTLGSNGAAGTLIIGESEYYAAGGIVNAATVTTGSGTGAVKFDTGTTRASPYYFTKDGTSSGTSVVIAGSTSLQNNFGYTVLSGTNTYSGGTTLYGGTLEARSNAALGSGTVTFNGGALNVASGVTLANALAFAANGGSLGGTGTFGSALIVGPNVHIVPGNSVGTVNFSSGLTLASGGTLDFEVQSAGTGYDLVNVSGGPLNLTATGANRFTLKIISLNVGGTPGPVNDFSSASSYAWTFATSAAGITGFDANAFDLNTASFANSLGVGSFFVTQSGNNLILNFTPVPEPSTYALTAAGLAVVGLGYRRRRKLLAGP